MDLGFDDFSRLGEASIAGGVPEWSITRTGTLLPLIDENSTRPRDGGLTGAVNQTAPDVDRGGETMCSWSSRSQWTSVTELLADRILVEVWCRSCFSLRGPRAYVRT